MFYCLLSSLLNNCCIFLHFQSNIIQNQNVAEVDDEDLVGADGHPRDAGAGQVEEVGEG